MGWDGVGVITELDERLSCGQDKLDKLDKQTSYN